VGSLGGAGNYDVSAGLGSFCYPIANYCIVLYISQHENKRSQRARGFRSGQPRIRGKLGSQADASGVDTKIHYVFPFDRSVDFNNKSPYVLFGSEDLS
jgi:hypothetical protein